MKTQNITESSRQTPKRPAVQITQTARMTPKKKK